MGGETWFIGPQRLAAMRLESEAYLRDHPEAQGPYREAPKPVPVADVPLEFVRPVNVKPLAVAMGLLMHELNVEAAPVAVLIAKAGKLGVSESTLRRAKRACNIKTIERDGEFYWELGVRLTG
jgi:hypothetical protein